MALCPSLLQPRGGLVLDPLLGICLICEIGYICGAAVIPTHAHVPAVADFERPSLEMNR